MVRFKLNVIKWQKKGNELYLWDTLITEMKMVAWFKVNMIDKSLNRKIQFNYLIYGELLLVWNIHESVILSKIVQIPWNKLFERINRDRRRDVLGCLWMSWDRILEDVWVCLKIFRDCQFYLIFGASAVSCLFFLYGTANMFVIWMDSPSI